LTVSALDDVVLDAMVELDRESIKQKFRFHARKDISSLFTLSAICLLSNLNSVTGFEYLSNDVLQQLIALLLRLGSFNKTNAPKLLVSGLTELKINSPLITDDSLEGIEKCVYLEHVDLSLCQAISRVNISSTELRTLVLDDTKIDDEQLSSLIRKNPNLEFLSAKRCHLLVNPDITSNSILEIHLFACNWLNNPHIDVPSLKVIDIRTYKTQTTLNINGVLLKI
jgi:hypothetical protein